MKQGFQGFRVSRFQSPSFKVRLSKFIAESYTRIALQWMLLALCLLAGCRRLPGADCRRVSGTGDALAGWTLREELQGPPRRASSGSNTRRSSTKKTEKGKIYFRREGGESKWRRFCRCREYVLYGGGQVQVYQPKIDQVRSTRRQERATWRAFWCLASGRRRDLFSSTR